MTWFSWWYADVTLVRARLEGTARRAAMLLLARNFFFKIIMELFHVVLYQINLLCLYYFNQTILGLLYIYIIAIF